MAKKKRNKQYRGKDSAITPEVIRIEAQQHSKLNNWWLDQKQDIIFKTVPIGIAIVIGLLLWMIISAIF